MGIIDDLLAAGGDKHALDQLMDRCLQTPAVIHSVAEGLRTGTPKAREACVGLLLRLAGRRPDLLADFVNDLLDATKQPSKKIARQALAVLAAVVPANSSAVFAEREHLLALARGGGPLGLGAVKALGALCASGANYRGKLVAAIVRLLSSDAFPDKDLARWLSAAAAAVEGSADGIKRLLRELEPRLQRCPEADRQRCDKVLAKLQRSSQRRR